MDEFRKVCEEFFNYQINLKGFKLRKNAKPISIEGIDAEMFYLTGYDPECGEDFVTVFEAASGFRMCAPRDDLQSAIIAVKENVAKNPNFHKFIEKCIGKCGLSPRYEWVGIGEISEVQPRLAVGKSPKFEVGSAKGEGRRAKLEAR